MTAHNLAQYQNQRDDNEIQEDELSGHGEAPQRTTQCRATRTSQRCETLPETVDEAQVPVIDAVIDLSYVINTHKIHTNQYKVNQ